MVNNMYKLKTLNKISSVGMSILDTNKFSCNDSETNPDGILVRSASLHEYDYTKNPELKAIARAGAGVNNIPIEKCTEKGIVVFNTPGANANAVKELIVAGLLLASRNVVDGVNWAKTLIDKGDEVPALVEKGKSNFGGYEIMGKKLGVIGLGAIGSMIANTALELGMEVYGFDPFLTVDTAWKLSTSIKKANDAKTIYENCDFITIHVPYLKDTKGYINKDQLAMMKDGVKILNFARGELIDDDAIGAALESGKVACYVTDFPNAKVLTFKNVVPIPHLGASTEESEDNCAVMAVKEVTEFINNGNIKNSVNFPDIFCERAHGVRVGIFHKNIPAMLTKISAVFAENNLNIENMLSKSKAENSYAILDIDNDNLSEDIIKLVEAIDGVIKVRIFN